MKSLLIAFLLLPAAVLAQKVKFNEYDKFIKQKRIEFEPLSILSSKVGSVSITYKSIGKTFYVLLSGSDWGATTIDAENEAIFLLSNDSTVTVKSTGVQTIALEGLHRSYKHQYFISQPDIEMLSKYEVKGIRKYNINDYVDMEVSKESAQKIKKLSSMFVEELKKAKILFTLENINMKDIAKYVGDSVKFSCKVYSSRYFDSSEGNPTVLDVNEDYNNPLTSIVIWGADRKNFANMPESLYTNKDVFISGVVRLVNNKSQITIHNRDQITLKSPISLEEASMFVGDSVTVRGTVVSGNSFQNSVSNIMLLNLGAANSDQALTVVMDGVEPADLPKQLENYYFNKEVLVTGKIRLFKNRPQIVIRNKDQLVVTKTSHSSLASTGNTGRILLSAGKDAKKEAVAVEKKAEFPGGQEAFKVFLSQNLQAPAELHVGESKTVYIQFLIDKDGSPKEFKVVQTGGDSFDKEAIRVLQKMPKWMPASKAGNPMARTITQPITFLGINE